MKTIITLAYAKASLHVITFLASASVSAQLSFALRQDNSFDPQQIKPAVNLTDYYVSVAYKSSQQSVSSAFPFLTASFLSNEPMDVNKESSSQVKIYRTSIEENKKLKLDQLVISFRPTSFAYPQNPGEDVGISEYSIDKFLLYATALKRYAKMNGYDTSYAFLGNMGMLGNKKRFFVVNLVTMEIEQSGLVAQGRGLGPSRFDRQYSNVKESKCTSLGRYKVFNKYKGEYGESYRLAGLDSTNDNAYSRNIVLHPMGCIPDEEEKKIPVCISEGCPAVSVNFLSSLTRIIDSAPKPVLLWLFDSNLEEIVAEQIPEDNVATEIGYEDGKVHHTCALHPRN